MGVVTEKRTSSVALGPTIREWQNRESEKPFTSKKVAYRNLVRDSAPWRAAQLYHTHRVLSIGKINKFSWRFLCRLHKNKIRQNIQKRKCIFVHFLQFNNISFSNCYLYKLRFFSTDKPIVTNKLAYILFLPFLAISIFKS